VKCDELNELTTDGAVVMAACGQHRLLVYGTIDWLVRGLNSNMTELPLQ